MAQSVAFVVGDKNVLGVSVFQLEIEGIRAPPWGFGRNLCRSINSKVKRLSEINREGLMIFLDSLSLQNSFYPQTSNTLYSTWNRLKTEDLPLFQFVYFWG